MGSTERQLQKGQWCLQQLVELGSEKSSSIFFLYICNIAVIKHFQNKIFSSSSIFFQKLSIFNVFAHISALPNTLQKQYVRVKSGFGCIVGTRALFLRLSGVFSYFVSSDAGNLDRMYSRSTYWKIKNNFSKTTYAFYMRFCTSFHSF